MKISVAKVTEMVGGKLLRGPDERLISGFDALPNCGESDLSFFGNPSYEKAFRESKAGAILVKDGVGPPAENDAAIIAVTNPTAAFDVIVRRYGAPELAFVPGVHPTAFVADDVELDPSAVSVGPNAVILGGAKVGAGTWIGANATVSEAVQIGADCKIYPQVVIREGSVIGNRVNIHSGSVIGADGYGYELQEGKHQKILQAGIVELEDDVEVGANVCIDRARFGSTVIGEGTKIDNLVQIGHNARIGKHCIVISQSGISGSAQIGDYVTMAAQSGVAGHVSVGDRTVVAARGGIIKDVEEETFQMGYPSMPMKQWTRSQMFQKKIPGLIKRIAELEARLEELESKAES